MRKIKKRVKDEICVKFDINMSKSKPQTIYFSSEKETICGYYLIEYILKFIETYQKILNFRVISINQVRKKSTVSLTILPNYDSALYRYITRFMYLNKGSKHCEMKTSYAYTIPVNKKDPLTDFINGMISDYQDILDHIHKIK